MDEPGFHARRRAAKVDAYYAHPPSGSHGENVDPLNEAWQGDLKIPEKNSYGHAEPSYRPPMDVDPLQIPGQTLAETHTHGAATYPGPPLSAVERSQGLPPPIRMDPHLQFMCGPLLRYDTVENGVWHGAAMIVTADAGSQYSPGPSVSLEWDPERPIHPSPAAHTNGSTPAADTLQPFDPYSRDTLPPLVHHDTFVGNGHARKLSSRAQRRVVPGDEIHVYHGTDSTFTFWRFTIQIPLTEVEMSVRYRVNGGAEIEFFVPAVDQNMRWAAYSCNGFSAGINPDDFKGPGFASGADPVWSDLLEKHGDKPFHALVGGGDQIYCDSLTREPELQEWVGLKTAEEKIAYPITDTIRFAIDRFYFRHYCLVFRNGAFARCNRSIPMVNMLDDHDLIDGFGSYPEDLQSSSMFSTIGSRGYFFFLLFQQFTVDAVDGTKKAPGTHPNKALILGGDGPWIPFKTHSLLTYLGPKVYMLLIDCRAERRKEQVCSSVTYNAIWKQLNGLPPSVEHLVVQLGIPIAYPRMNFLEATLDSKFNPLLILGRSGALGLSGFVNKFNKEAELLDDLNDHWTAKHHKTERNWLVQEFQRVALERQIRISFLSGDVHCAAVGVFKTLVKGKKKPAVEPAHDRRYMLNVVTSAIVNTPPPNGVLTMVSMLGGRKHKTMHHVDTDEAMVPLFTHDTNGAPLKSTTIMGRRNWCAVDFDQMTSELQFDIRVESQKGYGKTVGYAIKAPPPHWAS